ncbi:hypothetical protein BFO01nite_48410 [Brevibacillus formosus]|uniref:Uncharacterized protein n=1 Tax=Brevibacillus formosus TaxID=54913 RepID=A0ABQ0TDE9_9BACL|nr:hypothetical protein BFO01nite_48410 [Brevibacillus formosus]
MPSKFHDIDTNVKDLFENNQFQWMTASGVSSIVEFPIKHAIEAMVNLWQRQMIQWILMASWCHY